MAQRVPATVEHPQRVQAGHHLLLAQGGKRARALPQDLGIARQAAALHILLRLCGVRGGASETERRAAGVGTSQQQTTHLQHPERGLLADGQPGAVLQPQELAVVVALQADGEVAGC